ncbi:MAG: transporter associated domain-containing protein, partial [Pseudomonadota bacterium]|nr:transporter associated domain-containing protein [Pseudomonadota bacterium]
RAAIVLGEFGEVLGIVTMKDVLTFFFGEITGKMRGSEDYEQDKSGYQVPGDMRLLDFYNLTNIDIDDPVMTTIGGVVFRLFGRLPQVGETVAHEGYNFTVLEVGGLRISRLRVSESEVAEQEQSQEQETEPESGRAEETVEAERPASSDEDPNALNERREQ